MNNLNIKIQRIVYTIRDRFSSLGSGSTPTTDWRLLLLICTFVNAALIAYSVYLYVQVSVVSAAPVVSVSREVGSRNGDALRGIADTFATRRQEHSNILSIPPGVLDPLL